MDGWFIWLLLFGWIDRWMDGYMDGWGDRRMGRRMDKHVLQTHLCGEGCWHALHDSKSYLVETAHCTPGLTDCHCLQGVSSQAVCLSSPPGCWAATMRTVWFTDIRAIYTKPRWFMGRCMSSHGPWMHVQQIDDCTCSAVSRQPSVLTHAHTPPPGLHALYGAMHCCDSSLSLSHSLSRLPFTISVSLALLLSCALFLWFRRDHHTLIEQNTHPHQRARTHTHTLMSLPQRRHWWTVFELYHFGTMLSHAATTTTVTSNDYYCHIQSNCQTSLFQKSVHLSVVVSNDIMTLWTINP